MSRPLRCAAWLGMLSIAALVLAAAQRRQLASLRAGHQRLVASEPAASRPSPAEPAPPPRASPASAPLSDAEKLELLALRAEVTRLHERQRELGGVRATHAQLSAQPQSDGAASGSAAGTTPVPPGYKRKNQLRAAGFATPEAALESLFWAMAHRETDVLAQAVSPQAYRDLLQRHQDFEEASRVPGFLIRAQTPQPDGSIDVKLEILPGEEGPSFRVERVDGQWRVAL